MTNLNAYLTVLAMRKVDNLLQGCHLRVLPDAGVLRRDATLWRNGNDFCHDESRAACREAAKMLLVPGCHVAVLGRIPAGCISG